MTIWKYDRTTYAMFALLVMLTVADVVTTKYILSAGYHELNPFMAPIVDHIVSIKILAICIISAMSVFAEKQIEGTGTIVIGVPAAMTFYPVIHNLGFISTM